MEARQTYDVLRNNMFFTDVLEIAENRESVVNVKCKLLDVQ